MSSDGSRPWSAIRSPRRAHRLRQPGGRDRGWPWIFAALLTGIGAGCGAGAGQSADAAMGGSGGAGGGGDLDAADDGNPDRAPLVCPPASGEAEGASCSALEAEGPCVEQVQVDDSAPAPAGGTLVAGTYDLTERILYTNPGGPVGPTGGDPKRETMILAFTDGAWSLSVASLTGAVASRRLATVAPSGTRLGLVATCPAAGDGGTGGSAGGLYFTASEQALRLLEIRASGPVALDSYKRRAP